MVELCLELQQLKKKMNKMKTFDRIMFIAEYATQAPEFIPQIGIFWLTDQFFIINSRICSKWMNCKTNSLLKLLRTYGFKRFQLKDDDVLKIPDYQKYPHPKKEWIGKINMKMNREQMKSYLRCQLHIKEFREKMEISAAEKPGPDKYPKGDSDDYFIDLENFEMDFNE